ncbi:hypothetical protein FB45DRAFT_170772 [Roridomyces roridus]|uniref:Uncharacterized protein n=1 Tax=Roridomyces roridus TaxID=1738132 RepID=A0AAD7FHD3_9AGAR|nr:hypothetical protein FB45DRAFT_170772 [Roridomyces roridus]
MRFLTGYHHGSGQEQEHDLDYEDAETVPASGIRVSFNTGAPPSPYDLERAGRAPFVDHDHSHIYVGSAVFMHPSSSTSSSPASSEDEEELDGAAHDKNIESVHPCRVAPHLNPPCLVPFGGGVIEHFGRYDVLVVDGGKMVWVQSSYGRIPKGYTPVDGGYEITGQKLYHAVANVGGIFVPGKTGPHLAGCNIAMGDREVILNEGYQILCWRDNFIEGLY